MDNSNHANQEKGPYRSRRRFLQVTACTGLGLGALLANRVEGEERDAAEFKPLDKSDPHSAQCTVHSAPWERHLPGRRSHPNRQSKLWGIHGGRDSYWLDMWHGRVQRDCFGP